MNYLLEFVQGRVHKEWWVTRFVAWYCASRGHDMPRGRCHFGEIVLFYAPAYYLLGLFFRAARGAAFGIGTGVPLLFLPIGGFVRKASADSKAHRYRPWVVLALAYILGCGTGILTSSLLGFGSSTAISIPIVIVHGVSMYVLVWLAFWAGDYLARRFEPFAKLGQEAALAVERPRFRRMGSAFVTSVKKVPAGARRSWDIGAILFTLARDGWRKVCPILEYVDDKNSSTSVTHNAHSES